MSDLDTMEVDQEEQECEVISITDRVDNEGGHYYKVNWKGGDTTWEPISNLSGSSDALKTYLSEHHPDDPLLKIFNTFSESDTEEKENGENGHNKIGFLARWHQKTTRGSTKYWLRKGEDDESTVPSLFKRDVVQSDETKVYDDAPIATIIVPNDEEQSQAVFSDGEMTPTPKIVRKRYRIIEETVRMYPHEELGDLEATQSRIVALWQDMLSSVMLIGLGTCFFVYLYYSMIPRDHTSG